MRVVTFESELLRQFVDSPWKVVVIGRCTTWNVELSLQIKLKQDWTEAGQQFRILLHISVLDAFVFLGKELEKHKFPGNTVDEHL